MRPSEMTRFLAPSF